MRFLSMLQIETRRSGLLCLLFYFALVLSVGRCGSREEEKATPSTPSHELAPVRTQITSVEVPEGYRVELVREGMIQPTSVDIDDSGAVYVAESSRIWRATPQDDWTVIAETGIEIPVEDLLWSRNQLYVSHRGKISVVDAGGGVTDLVTDLPSRGDHSNTQLVAGPDGKIYFGQGTVTNSGVVGLDNLERGWLRRHPLAHDIPAFDLSLVGQAFKSQDGLTRRRGQVATTSAFHSFGLTAEPEVMVEAEVKSSGTVLRMNPDGSELEVFASGFRNPQGLAFAEEGLLCAENGFENRGSRPITNDADDLYLVKQGGWYGWPDFASGIPVTDPRFQSEGAPAIEFLLLQHPTVELPLKTFPKGNLAKEMVVDRAGQFGPANALYLAFSGDPARINRGEEVFFRAKSSPDASPRPGPLVDVQLSPTGNALYIVDYEGRLWRVVK